MNVDTINTEEIEKKIGYIFVNKNYLITAFTHRSYLNENNTNTGKSNERLEFLGDAILQFLTSDYIYNKHPGFPEGELTNLRSRLVNTDSLAAESARLQIAQYLLVSKGEKETALNSSHIRANLFEAIVGAIYLDSTIETCQEFLEKNLFYKTDQIIDKGTLKDSKSLYQEITQEKYGITPTYRVLSEEGPDHDKTFSVGVYLENKKTAEGTGPSKRKAQQQAAENALKQENAQSN